MLRGAMFKLLLKILAKVTKSSFVGAIALGDLVKSTLGPKGMVWTPSFFFL